MSRLPTKRKVATEEDELADQPRKLPAIGSSTSLRPRRDQPLRDVRTNGLAASRSTSKTSLTIPKAPTRATSAPPKSHINTGISTGTRAGAIAGRRPIGGLSVSRPGHDNDSRFVNLESQVASIQSATDKATASLAAQMDLEREKAASLHAELQSNQLALERRLEEAKKMDDLQRREISTASDEIANLKRKHQAEITDLEMDLRKKDREHRETTEDLRECRASLERERAANEQLKATLSQLTNFQLSISSEKSALEAQLSALKHLLDSSSSTNSSLNLVLETERAKVARLEVEAREAEGVRRKLHNMVLELKGNIRVFCRVRPVLPSELQEATTAGMTFPDKRDHKEIVLSSTGESATGQERKEVYNFGFDRVFEPESTQADVFEEISLLAQSCMDGYNVCIFAYGQTGSGKSFTMEGGSTPDTMGMIPRAVNQLFRVAEELKEKGWSYTMEGQFLEIYNETINDLLGSSEFDKKKHEIKHDPRTLQTRVTDVAVTPLHSPTQVTTLLSVAHSRRSVAATLMNERSSRSHSVFTVRITGVNASSGERCEGSLNLVDLAGSERLDGSGTNNKGVEKERLMETKSINKSLSALGDVIAALGEKGEGKGDKHVPYRNSKLTYLLQNSLSGNSKTLMVLNLSPLAAHLNESLTSLRFATKVNSTQVGTAKKHSRLS